MTYRPDVDGLRALAVLPVLLFHAHAPGFSGGFVGVDVFFVISGFLITSLLVRRIEAGTLSLGDFYERRIKRLLPAFIVVAAFSVCASIPIVSPAEIEALGNQVMASAVFSSNAWFFANNDYFAGSSESNILLHTWSLAVEEQFYLLFPLVLLLIGNRSTVRYGVVAAIALGSFALAQACSTAHPDFNFYLLPTRAWELMVGSLLALHTPRWARHPALAVLGLVGIGLSVVWIQRSTPFPSVYALPAVLGTAAVIASAPTTLVGRALSFGPLVHIGKISYSLYLWHWPLLLLVGKLAGGGQQPSATARATALLLAFPAAHLTWRFVEQTTRHSTRPRRQIFGAALAWTAIALAIGAFCRSEPESVSMWDDDAKRKLVDSPRCFTLAANRVSRCDIGPGEKTPHVFFWGDSHGNALLPAIQVAAKAEKWKGAKLFLHGCPPLLDVDPVGTRRCHGPNAEVLRRVVAAPNIEAVVLMGRWGLNYWGQRPEEPWNPRLLVDHRGEATDQHEVFELGIRRTVHALQEAGKKVYIVTGTPEFDADVAYSLGLSTHLGTPRGPELSRAAFRVRNQDPNALFRALVGQKNLIDAGSKLCGHSEICPLTNAKGELLYIDSDHLSPAGARMVAPVFTRRFRKR